MKTEDKTYSRHLQDRSSVWWKRALPVQYPYRRFVRKIFPTGKILDVGCGYGRILHALPPGSIGVDHNPDLIETGRAAGLDICSPSDFLARFPAGVGAFDGLVCAHVVEHMRTSEAIDMLSGYLSTVRPGRPCVLITPQQKGFKLDATHVQYYGLQDLHELAGTLGLVGSRELSYPFPPAFGSWFAYNENIVVACTPLH